MNKSVFEKGQVNGLNGIQLFCLILSLLPLTIASTGDRLPEFQTCLADCKCDEIPWKLKSSLWSCSSNCNYFCQQTVTDIRQAERLRMVQFYGKWPFRQVWGVQEIFSSMFSLGNFYVNWVNFWKIYKQYKKNQAFGHKLMYRQYLILLLVSCCGWSFSVIFHIKDTSFTEILDYFGAFAIILSNLNVIVVRYFGLYFVNNMWKLKVFHLALVMLYLYHVIRLYRSWDYEYNMKINMIVGLSAMVLWIVHSLQVARIFRDSFIKYHNSVLYLHYETKILWKMGYIFISDVRLIPYIPIVNNCVLLCGIMLELNDFEPWFRLVDAHSLWHLLTIVPNLIWFDWNIWDIELSKIIEKR